MRRALAKISVKAILLGALGLAVAGASVSACSGSELRPSDPDGAIGLALQLAGGVTLSSASYSISGPGAFTRSGVIDVAKSATISAVVGGIPAAAGYAINVTATGTDGVTSCGGSALFSVAAHATTAVMIHLTCHQSARTGSVAVSGTINVCPSLDGVTASPAEVVVGNTIALSAAATDPDASPSPLSYHWIASAGSLDDPSAPSPTFTCLFPGAVTITVAVSDGDAAATCADSGSIQVNCTAAGPQVYAWIEMGTGGQAIARLISPNPSCPSVFIDGASHPMNLRVPAGTAPLRTTASPAAMSKASEFPVSVCEAPIPAGASSIVVAGRALPAPRARPNRIVVLGDTGCRLKVGNPWQACSDPTEWPLAEIARNAASLNPDLVVHVGDYHYRENACPPDIGGCQGSPWGYGFDAWEADLFQPAASLMAAAPWIMVRGNHEQCMRAGQGWYRFLDTAPYSEARSCNDPANDNLGNYTPPFAVPVGGDAQVIVFDSSNVASAALDPAHKAADVLMFNNYQAQLQAVAALATPDLFNIFTNHHPLLAYTSVAGANPTGGNPALLSVMAATYPGTYFPPNIGLVLEGHNHIFEAIDYATPHPVTILSGNGGDNLDLNLPDPFPLGPAASGGDEPAPGVVADAIADMSSFGFVVLERGGSSWTATEIRHDGTVMDTCLIDRSADKISCAKAGFLH